MRVVGVKQSVAFYTLDVIESKTEEKEIMTRLVMNFLTLNNS